MIALTFEIHALEPLLVTRLEGDPNSAVSHPYVPGSVIRGALASRYLPTHSADFAGDRDGRRLFFDGSTRYLNAYPLDRNGNRSLSVPRSWVYEKGRQLQDGEPLYDFSVEVLEHLKQPKGLGERFCRLVVTRSEFEDEDDVGLVSAEVEFVDPRWQINVHTARERVKGRATEEEGAVFRYQAIAAGERFGGVILVSDPEDAGILGGLLAGGDLWLGGSRSGGYGRVRIENVQRVEGWRETEADLTDLGPGDRLVITLLSDAILRRGDGSYADTLTSDLLPAPLSAALSLVPEPEPASFKRVGIVGGFNRKWGLPLYQVQAVQAGSVFVLDVTGTISASELEKLEAQGIGERRAEGFGRVAANWAGRELEWTIREIDREQEIQVERLLSLESKALAKKMVERMLRRELDRRLVRYIYDRRLGDISSWPSNAQLSRLRAVALNALPLGDVGRLREFLCDKKLKARAREQYQAARIDGVRLLGWLRERLEHPQDIWGQMDSAGIPLPQIGGVQAELSEPLAREYTIRLVEGVLHRAAKKRVAEERGHE
jgi:CRISPR-associated protein Csx10